MAHVIASGADDESAASQAVNLLSEHSDVVSCSVESPAELVHIQHNQKLFNSEL